MRNLLEKWNQYSADTDRRISLEFNHSLTERLFALDEADAPRSQEALEGIKNNDWEPSSPKSFYDSLTCKSADDSCVNKHPEMTTGYNLSDLTKMKLYKLEGMNIGFAIKELKGRHQEIVAVHNNEAGVGGIGRALMESAIENGGCFLDHFATPALNNLYSKLGFEEYEKYDFDPQYVSDGFVEKYGEVDVILRRHKDC
tara:strand:+ start:409 stop:1005 length:597 start_codon:yes stop_codon:yes gene_type:complete